MFCSSDIQKCIWKVCSCLLMVANPVSWQFLTIISFGILATNLYNLIHFHAVSCPAPSRVRFKGAALYLLVLQIICFTTNHIIWIYLFFSLEGRFQSLNGDIKVWTSRWACGKDKTKIVCQDYVYITCQMNSKICGGLINCAF